MYAWFYSENPLVLVALVAMFFFIGWFAVVVAGVMRKGPRAAALDEASRLPLVDDVRERRSP